MTSVGTVGTVRIDAITHESSEDGSDEETGQPGGSTQLHAGDWQCDLIAAIQSLESGWSCDTPSSGFRGGSQQIQISQIKKSKTRPEPTR